MNDINNGNLICRLTKDSEIEFMQSGSAKCTFSVAFTTSRKNGTEWVDETNYINGLTLWGKTAENLHQYMKKGTLIGLSYHLKMDSWNDKEGNKKTMLKVVADNVQLLSRPSSVNNSESAFTPAEQAGFSEGSSNDFPEDVPF